MAKAAKEETTGREAKVVTVASLDMAAVVKEERAAIVARGLFLVILPQLRGSKEEQGATAGLVWDLRGVPVKVGKVAKAELAGAVLTTSSTPQMGARAVTPALEAKAAPAPGRNTKAAKAVWGAMAAKVGQGSLTDRKERVEKAQKVAKAARREA